MPEVTDEFRVEKMKAMYEASRPRNDWERSGDHHLATVQICCDLAASQFFSYHASSDEMDFLDSPECHLTEDMAEAAFAAMCDVLSAHRERN